MNIRSITCLLCCLAACRPHASTAPAAGASASSSTPQAGRGQPATTSTQAATATDRPATATDRPATATDRLPTATDQPTTDPARLPTASTHPQESQPGQAHAAEPIPAKINEHYRERTDPQRWAAQFERKGREVFDRREQIVAALNLRPGMAVADVGAGTGLFTMEFATAVGPTGRVFAVDVHQYFLDHIAKRAKTARLTNVDTRLADQRRANLAVDSVDVVFLCDAYHHLEFPREYLAELRAALRPHGRLVVIDYDLGNAAVQRRFVDHLRATPAQVRQEIEAAGFVLREQPGLLDENFMMVFEVGSESANPASKR